MNVDKNFRYQHLPADKQEISRRFHDLAHWINNQEWPDEEEKQFALRKLVESKDCAVRASMP